MIQQQVTLEWHSVKTDGLPDHSGMYLCRFNDGSVETYPFDAESRFERGWHRPLQVNGGEEILVVFWTDIPEAP
jgi:hypothetical protein